MNPEILAGSRLLPYSVYQWQGYKVAPHLRLIAKHLEAVERGDIRRLVISMPPRHGKSQLATVNFPAWYLGRNPDKFVISVSHNQDLADDFGRQVRNQVRSDWYRKVFPYTNLREDSTSIRRFHMRQNGVFHAAGVGAGISGKGAHLGIFDDPYKNRADANSDARRKEIRQFYQSEFYPRLMPGDSAIVIIHTRWAEDDLIGWVLSDHSHEGWVELRLPAIADSEDDPIHRAEGEALWPGMYPLDRLAEIKSTIGSAEFQSLYQQRPVREGGNYLKLDWWGRYDVQEGRYRMIVQSIDSAMKTGRDNDYSVISTFGIGDGHYDLLNVWREKVEAPELQRAVIAQADKWKPSHILGEDTAGLVGVMQWLKRTSHLPMLPIKAERDKVSRVQSIAGLVEAGKVRLPNRAPWLADFLDETSGFPAAPHDDIVDTLTQFLNWIRENESGRVEYTRVKPTRTDKYGGL